MAEPSRLYDMIPIAALISTLGVVYTVSTGETVIFDYVGWAILTGVFLAIAIFTRFYE